MLMNIVKILSYLQTLDRTEYHMVTILLLQQVLDPLHRVHFIFISSCLNHLLSQFTYTEQNISTFSFQPLTHCFEILPFAVITTPITASHIHNTWQLLVSVEVYLTLTMVNCFGRREVNAVMNPTKNTCCPAVTTIMTFLLYSSLTVEGLSTVRTLPTCNNNFNTKQAMYSPIKHIGR
jgi:hypothetical protein